MSQTKNTQQGYFTKKNCICQKKKKKKKSKICKVKPTLFTTPVKFTRHVAAGTVAFFKFFFFLSFPSIDGKYSHNRFDRDQVLERRRVNADHGGPPSPPTDPESGGR